MNLFSTEQISKYHPDKYADQISDAIVCIALAKNINARCAVETLVKDRTVIVAGEIGGVELSELEINATIRFVATKLNYKVEKIINLLGKQSEQINKAVDNDTELGAGDQGLMFGYATRETKTYLPKAFDLANQIIERIEQKADEGLFFEGDAKTQVTIDLDTNEIEKVLVSVCYQEEYSLEEIQQEVKELLKDLVDPKLLLINPSGVWTIGGPTADAGLTGRKIIADTYGGFSGHGGGAFSGKDLSKVDRSGAYAARNIAIDMLKKFKSLEWVEIQLAYAIGIATPMSVNVKSSHQNLNKLIRTHIQKKYNLNPRALIKRLNLKPNDYMKLASGCHFKGGYVGKWI